MERVIFGVVWQTADWHELPPVDAEPVQRSVECSEAIGDADASGRSAQPAVTRSQARTFDWATVMKGETRADRAKG
jgi:hypothetical protein